MIYQYYYKEAEPPQAIRPIWAMSPADAIEQLHTRCVKFLWVADYDDAVFLGGGDDNQNTTRNIRSNG